MAAEPLSPELVLVSPELREHALSMLPRADAEVDAEARLAVAPRPAAPDPAHSFPLALAVYIAEAVFLGALRGAAMIAVIAAAAFLLAR